MSSCGLRAPFCDYRKSKLYHPVSTSWLLIGSASREPWQETRGGRQMNKGYLLLHSLLAQPQFKQWPCLSAATYCAGSTSFRALDLSEFCCSFPTPLSLGLNSSLLLLLLRCLTVVGRITAPILKNPVNVLCCVARENSGWRWVATSGLQLIIAPWW